MLCLCHFFEFWGDFQIVLFEYFVSFELKTELEQLIYVLKPEQIKAFVHDLFSAKLLEG